MSANPIAFRVATLLSYFLAAWLMHSILIRTPGISPLSARLASLLFLLAPVNSARIAMVMTFTALSTLALFAGWWMVAQRSSRRNVAGAILLLGALSVAALQPLTALIVGHLVYIRWVDGGSLRALRTWAPVGLFALPLLAEVLNAAFWPSTGSYSQYYAIRPQGVVRATLILGVAILVLGALLIRRRRQREVPVLAGVGTVALALGAYAYMVGGHLVGLAQWLLPLVPEHSDWDSRHSAVLGVGIGLIGAGLSRESASADPSRRRLLTNGTTVALLCFVCLNLTYSFEYLRDAVERHDFVGEARSTVDLTGITSVVIADRTLGTDARGRIVRDEEWLAMLREAGWDDPDFVFRSGRGDCHPNAPTHALVIAMTTGRFETLFHRDTDLWLKLEPFDEREHGVTYVSNQPGTAGMPCVK